MLPTIASSAESGSPSSSSSSRPVRLSRHLDLLSHDEKNKSKQHPPLGTPTSTPVAGDWNTKDRGGRTRGTTGKDHHHQHPRSRSSLLFSVSESAQQETQDEFELQDYPQQPKHQRPHTHTGADNTADTNPTPRDRAARREEKKARKRRWLEAQDEMKFSHSIQFNAVPDWSTHYIAYSNLKKL